MDTNRIIFRDVDESAYISGGQTSLIGGTVVKAPRGIAVPTLFAKGSSQAIKYMLGSPSKDYPDIQEAIEFNNVYSLYISAPPGVKTNLTNYYGGVYLTTEGSVEEFYKVIDPEEPGFDIEVIAAGSSPFAGTSTKAAYASQTITISGIDSSYFETNRVSNIYVTYPTLDGNGDEVIGQTTSVKLKLGVGGAIVTDETTPVDVGDLVLADNAYSIVLAGNASVADFNLTALGDLDVFLGTPANYARLTVSWIYNIDDYVVQTLYQNSPRSSETKFTISDIDVAPLVDGEANPYYNTMTFSFKEIQNGIDEYSSSSYTISTDVDAVDGYNASLYYENVLDAKAGYFIGSKVYLQYTDITTPYVTPVVSTVSGVRVIEDSTFVDNDLLATLSAGWDEYLDPMYESVDIMFDASGIAGIKDKHSSLRTASLKTTTFLSPIKVGTSSTADAVVAIGVARGTSPKTKGLGFTCNEFLIKDSASNEYWSSIIGSVAVNYANIMVAKLGGAAPMWTNAENVGGQLSRSVKKQKYKFTADQLDTLDTAGVNPIILDSYYGLMLTSQKTAASVPFLTDWSFFGHSMAFDLLKKEMKREVLIPQLGKAITPFYLELRQSQTEAIVNKRLVGATAIWTDAKVLVNDVSVNNDETKMQNKFVVKVRVKVTPFTEWVEFILNNTDQKTTL